MNYTWQHKPKEKRGILCGVDAAQEWLLPWWWERYSALHHYPVTFCDYGMTEEAHRFCSERGTVIPISIDTSFVKPKEEIDPFLAKIWEECHGKQVWKIRAAWFKKPFTFLHSHYEKGIWLDLDCEVLKSLDPLFSLTLPSSGIALVREYTTDHLPKIDPGARYNGGVVVYQHGAPLFEKWAEGSVTLNHLFAGDDTVLSHLIYEEKYDVLELPEIYNWRMMCGLNLDAVVVHWVATSKNYIRTHGGLKPTLDAFWAGLKR